MKRLIFTSLLFGVFAISSCGGAAVRGDLLGLTIGMTRAQALQHLTAIGELQRQESGRQEIWRLNSDARFNTVAVGFDRDDQVRYVTAFVDKSSATERISFTSVGNISRAHSEIVGQHHRYIWNTDEYTVNVYGDDPDLVTIYTLARPVRAGAVVQEEDDD